MFKVIPPAPHSDAAKLFPYLTDLDWLARPEKRCDEEIPRILAELRAKKARR